VHETGVLGERSTPLLCLLLIAGNASPPAVRFLLERGAQPDALPPTGALGAAGMGG